jgi:hypothetical protein
MTNYYPGDVVQVVHKDSGMEFSETTVHAEHLDGHVIYLMGATWMIDSDEIFESLYPNFMVKLIKRGNDENSSQ